jgi:hypothetical protein
MTFRWIVETALDTEISTEAAVLILKTHDVVLPQVAAQLHLDDFQRPVPWIG